MILNSAKLRQYRERFRYSQSLLAEEMQLSQTTVWSWEQKDTDVKLEYLIQLAELFQTGINELTQSDAVQQPETNTSGIQSYLARQFPSGELVKQLGLQLSAVENRIFHLEEMLKQQK